MFGSVLKKVFGSKNERVIKSIQPLVAAINQLEPEIQKLDDVALVAKTVLFRERLAAGVPLDDLLPEAFAVCREAAWRVLGMRHFDVQLIGGIVLHQGKIAEMKTGEGKTLAATLPVYLNALTGRGVHVVTVNDYLARRDAEWMGKLYRFLGLSVGSILHGMDDAARREAYASDITYGTNNEFGFDYLRDNMKFDLKDFCQREFHYAIVDEVDSILIDEARTPLIISGPAEMSTELYERVNRLIHKFKSEEHYTLDEKTRSVSLSDEGVTLGEKLLGVENLYDPRNIEWLHHLNQALRANVLFKRDVDYLVRDGQVVIVDEFTGRAMPGRRFSDGLHQALEAKEGVKVEQENQTLASITFQNYFRMYEKLSGMTGTADTEAAEFKKIYNLNVVIIPTHNTMIRKDYADVIYKNAKAKDRAIIREIQELHKKGQPVLVGTISIDVSEKISAMLKKVGVPHEVLNAKQHEREAEIVADAGQKGHVTIATNMAGRGTDIKLGEGVTELGGLHILGTSRHESRRIDNQLRGRSGRQGDPGSSRFYLSLEDDLLRIFGSDRISGIMDKLGMEEDEPIEHTMISRAIENAQRKVEGNNFDIRKHLLEYDDVMNKQREVIYRQRREVLGSDDIHEVITDMFPEMAEMVAGEFADTRTPSEEWDWAGVSERMYALFGFSGEWSEADKKELDPASFVDLILAVLNDRYANREQEVGDLNLRHLERVVLLQIVDHHWKEHLLNMDHLKEGIGLRGYGQKNPLDEYKKEGFNMFGEMIGRVKTQTVSTLFRLQLVREEEVAELERKQREQRQPMQLSRGPVEDEEHKPFSREGDKIGRNTDCPCGSGQKYKRCCGKSGGKK
ncbi:MAG: preprotein translocase subunit SecA [Desulfobulbaceae bacterium]|nr:preprotein translocase subunit SecA [Desulfobulbaceae bacterium]HIJ90209.1 preprotein translocase subunit SecA [Deltaproteobacteria bacterium]